MKNLLIIATTTAVPGTAQLPRALTAAGLDVGVISPQGSLVSKTRYVSVSSRIRGAVDVRAYWDAMVGVAKVWPYEYVVPADDWALRYLNQIADHCDQGHIQGSLAEIVRRSTVAPEHRRTIEQKTGVVNLAAGLGIAVAQQVRPESPEQVREFCRLHGLPIVVKADMSTSGAGVMVAETEEAAVELALQRGIIRGGRVPWDQNSVVLQRFVRGVPASITLACHQGRVLAAFGYVARERDPMPTGPATVIEIVNRPDMLRVAERLIGHLGCTGLMGLDFVIEEGTDTAYFLEINPRPPQTSHLGPAAGVNLPRALAAALAGTPLAPALQAEAGKLIALFPNEWLRDPKSPYLASAHHPVPWDDPGLVSTILSRYAPRIRRPDGRVPADITFLMVPNL